MQGRRLHDAAPQTETEHSIDIRQSDSILAYRRVATEYLATHAPEAEEYLSYLHENDQRHNIVLDKQPDYAIYIPIAANETEENIRGALDAIIKNPFQKPEVFLHANYTDKTPFADRINLTERIDRLMEEYRDTPEFSALRSVLAPVRYHKYFSMVELRKEASDMIAADARERGLPFNYPVVSLDTDAERLSRTTLESLVTPIKEEGATLTYGDSNVGYKNVPDSIEARLAVAGEVIRRMEIRHGANADPYPEESCTAFSLGAYCMANGYPPLIQNDYDRSNLTGETPKLIQRMNALLESSDYQDLLSHLMGKTITDPAPRHVDNAMVTRNGRRNLVYFATQLTDAESNPERFADLTRRVQEVLQAGPTLDRYIATGGAYAEEFKSQEAMREDNGISNTRITIPRSTLDLVLKDYFGPERTSIVTTSPEEKPLSSDPKLRMQQLVVRRYFGKK